MGFESFKDKYSCRSPERIWYLKSVRLFFSISLLTLSAFPPCVSLTNVGLIHSQLFSCFFFTDSCFYVRFRLSRKKTSRFSFYQIGVAEKTFSSGAGLVAPLAPPARGPQRGAEDTLRGRRATRRRLRATRRRRLRATQRRASLLSIRNTDYSASFLKTSLILHM